MNEVTALIFLASLALGVVVLYVAYRQGTARGAEILLFDGDPARRDSAARALASSRAQLERRLIDVIESPLTSDEDRLTAVGLAGEYRIVSAVPSLVRRITWSDPSDEARRSYSTNYPAVGALIRIGTPAPAYVLDSIDGSEDPLKLSLYGVVLSEVDGVDAGIARVMARRLTAPLSTQTILQVLEAEVASWR
jgi:hypothetical protein